MFLVASFVNCLLVVFDLDIDPGRGSLGHICRWCGPPHFSHMCGRDNFVLVHICLCYCWSCSNMHVLLYYPLHLRVWWEKGNFGNVFVPCLFDLPFWFSLICRPKCIASLCSSELTWSHCKCTQAASRQRRKVWSYIYVTRSQERLAKFGIVCAYFIKGPTSWGYFSQYMLTKIWKAESQCATDSNL